MENKNFRVASSCSSCKHFASIDGYSGRRKNSYCLVHVVEKSIPRIAGSYKLFEYIWHGKTLDEIIELDKTEKFRYLGYGTYPTYDNYKSLYDIVKETVDFWKENGDKIHTCNAQNLCDLYEKKRNSSHATRHVNNNKIDWLEELDNKKEP